MPFYHVVSDEPKAHYDGLYPIKSVAEFTAELDFLVKYFKPISLTELIALKKEGKRISEKCFHLTFDDGLKELYTIVAPILREKNIPATFFINTDFMDNKALFYRFKASLLVNEFGAKGMLDLPFGCEEEIDVFAETLGFSFEDYLQNEQPYLTSSQITELISDGFTIGGHSKSHPLYKDISLNEQLAETMDSVNSLTEQFKLAYKVFSFPFTDDGVGKEFYQKINSQLDLTFGTAGIKKDVADMNLQRIGMEENRSGADIIKAQYFYYVLKKFAGKNQIKR